MSQFDPSKFESEWSVRSSLVDSLEQLENTVQIIRAVHPEHAEALDLKLKQIRDTVEKANSVLGISALDHFKGKGLVASRFRQRIEEDRFLRDLGDAEVQRLEQKLEVFDFHPIEDMEQVQAVTFAIMQAFPITMGQVPTIPVIGKFDINDLRQIGTKWFEPGLYAIDAPNRPSDHRVLVFEGTLPNNPDLEINVMVIGFTPPLIKLRHKLEDFEAVFDHSYTFEGLDEFITENINTLKHKYGAHPGRNFDLEHAVMEQKVRSLYDQIEMLKQGNFENLKDQGKGYFWLEFNARGYQFIFRFGKPSPEAEIMTSKSIFGVDGLFNLYPNHIPEDERPLVFNSVMCQIDTMTERVNKLTRESILKQN